MTIAFTVALVLGVPGFLMWAAPRSAIVRGPGPIVWAYAAGIAAGNAGLTDPGTAEALVGAAVALAIPLLVFPTDVPAWLRTGGSMVAAFAAAVVSVVACAASVGAAWRGAPHADALAAMFTGMYIGGTVNLNAVGTMLAVPAEIIAAANAADVVLGGAWLLALLSVVPRLAARVFRPFDAGTRSAEQAAADAAATHPTVRGVATAVGLSALVVAVSAGVGALVPPPHGDTITLFAVSTLGLALSFVPRVRELRGSEVAGDWFLLAFAVGVGSLADFASLGAALAGPIAPLAATLMVSAVALHLVLCYLMRIDRDTALIASTAAIFGPPFIGPVAFALGNRDLVPSGVAAGLVGIAVGNQAGLFVFYLVSSGTP